MHACKVMAIDDKGWITFLDIFSISINDQRRVYGHDWEVVFPASMTLPIH